MLKHFGIVVLLAALSSALTIPNLHSQYITGVEHYVEEKLSRFLALAVLGEITERSDPLFPVIPPLPDPATLGDVYLTLPDGAGNITFCYSTATGTSKITDDLTFEVEFPAKVHYWLNVPNLFIAGKHDANVLLFGGAVNVVSIEDYTFNLTNFFLTLDLDVSIELDGQFEVVLASTGIVFDSIWIDTTETLLNGEEFIWEDFSPAIKIIFDFIWPKIKPTVDEQVRDIANEIFRECNIYIMMGGDLSCLNTGYQLVHKELAKDSLEIISVADGICPPPPVPAPDDGSYFMYSETITDYGNWASEPDKCPAGSWASGFQVKTESYQSPFADDTCMNALKLYCSGSDTTVMSKEGNWGDWGTTYRCNNGGHIVGFQLRSESGGQVDNTAANNIRMFCSDNPTQAIEGDGLDFGDWRSVFTCDDGFAICGIKTQVQPPQSAVNDDTALNNIALLCCPV